jgi:hypothetical protein
MSRRVAVDPSSDPDRPATGSARRVRCQRLFPSRLPHRFLSLPVDKSRHYLHLRRCLSRSTVLKMAALDPVQSIRDAIAHLETETADVEAEIRQIRAEADNRVTELEASIASQRQDLKRWRAALARAEGRAGAPQRPSSRSSSAAPVISDDELLRALSEFDEPASVSELRTALRVDPDVRAEKVTRLLGDAVKRGVLVRTGERRGTRYSAA